MRVVIAARRRDLLQEVASQVEAVGGEALAYAADLSLPEQIDALAAATMERFGRVDVLIANAGVSCVEPLESITEQQMSDTVEINLLGVMRSARVFLPMMIAQKTGHIITVSSVIVGMMWPNDAIYASTKAGVHRFSKGLRNEVRRHGIHVTDVVPGVVDTPLTKGLKGMPKADPNGVAEAVIGVLVRPRAVVVTPAWYRVLLAANKTLPGTIDALIAYRLRHVK